MTSKDCLRSTALFLLLPLSGLATAQNAPGDTSPADAASLFESGCVSCHGADGRGRSRDEVGFDTPLPDFTDCDFATREPNADWSAIIHEGGPVRGFNQIMPSFSEALTDDQIDLLLTHLRGFCVEPDWPRGELNLPRALFTEKAFPEDEAVIETSVVTEGNDSFSNKFIWEQRFGTRNQMELSIPFTRADLGAEGWANGVGDLAVAVKHVLHHSLERGSILSVGGELLIATGDEQRGFSKGTNVLETYLSYGKVNDNAGFIQLQGTAEFPAKAGFDDEIGLRAAFGRTWTSGGPFGRAWTPIIEVLGARELDSGADTDWDVVPQFQVTLSQRQHIMANVGVRLPVTSRSTRESELVFYLLWDWYDGGVLEGWR